jgi:hypothetical protein
LCGDHGRIADVAEMKRRHARAGEMGPLIIGLDAGHPHRIYLPVKSNLASGKRAAHAEIDCGNASAAANTAAGTGLSRGIIRAIGDAGLGPCVAAVGADIEPGPLQEGSRCVMTIAGAAVISSAIAPTLLSVTNASKALTHTRFFFTAAPPIQPSTDVPDARNEKSDPRGQSKLIDSARQFRAATIRDGRHSLPTAMSGASGCFMPTM